MKDIAFVAAENIETLEHYAAAIVSCMVSLRSLENYHLHAHSKGILQEDEDETCKTICWEFQRIAKLHITQFEQIARRCDIDESKIIASLQQLLNKPKKRRKIGQTECANVDIC